jgi:asparagine synthase (glutamine-hydrolysing)
MSVQFGRWHFENQSLNGYRLASIQTSLAPYSPDGGGHFTDAGIDILYGAFHTTRESQRESQPFLSQSGAIVTWDGRLDNRVDLLSELGCAISVYDPDVAIASAAFDRWRTACFARLIGDWAISVWDPRDRTLFLAKDFLGTRHLYYQLRLNQITWSSLLETLVLDSEISLEVDEEYIAGWVSLHPAAERTPYQGILAVRPSSYLEVRNAKASVHECWNFEPARRIRYRNDNAYEEHYRALFSESVRARLRSNAPVRAELSGGIDSSSIVCIADRAIAQGCDEAVTLDTISFYDDAETNWDERPFFTEVERQRGRSGCHINVGGKQEITFAYDSDSLAATPSSPYKPSASAEAFKACLVDRGNRVVLSGIGGDEVLGGVPTPYPELADLFARGNLLTLGKHAAAWALAGRSSLWHLCAETVRCFLPLAFVGPQENRIPAWLDQDFVKRNRKAVHGYPRCVTLFGPLPSFQENIRTLDSLRRQLACFLPGSHVLYEKRYPYLDRNLLEFLYAVPREQILRPGQRRSLMRRSLAGIVPEKILNRKRKAFVCRSPAKTIAAESKRLFTDSSQLALCSLGIVDRTRFADALQRAVVGRETQIVALLRTIALEYWLRHISNRIPSLCLFSKSQGRGSRLSQPATTMRLEVNP